MGTPSLIFSFLSIARKEVVFREGMNLFVVLMKRKIICNF